MAQNFENQNPYSIFGKTFVLGEEVCDNTTVDNTTVDKIADTVFVIQNTVVDSPIARLEHNTRTGIVKFFDRDGRVVGEKQLTDMERAWLTQDRFAEKYYSISPYAYAAGNPIRYVDINGDSLWIAHRGENYLYNNGTLSLNGEEYAGKVNGFLKQTVNALGSIAGTAEGMQMITELSTSENNFTIIRGSENKFNASNSVKAYGQEHISINSATYQMMGMGFVRGGSGGTIMWNPSGASLPTTAGMINSPFMVLGHEMAHGWDANRGAMISGDMDGVKNNEWQAVYRENIIRRQAGLPLRTHYGTAVTPEGVRVGGAGVRMITPANTPVLPLWYRH